MLIWLGLVTVALVVGAVLFDVVSIRRGSYRPPSHWKAAAGRRKRHFRDVKQRRSEDAQHRRPY